MKKCVKCNILKSVKNFTKVKYNKDGRRSYCNECHNNLNKLYRNNNLEKNKENARKRYEEKKEIIDKQNRESYHRNKYKNIEHKKIVRKLYYELNKEKIQKTLLKRLNLPEVREKLRKYQREWARKKIKLDLNFRIKKNLRCRIWSVLNGIYKSKRTEQLLGCTIDELKNYLSNKFQSGMSWKNYGKWHIDHIKPCDAFDLTKEEEQSECFNYTNLQPLWKIENLRKSNKIIANLDVSIPLAQS